MGSVRIVGGRDREIRVWLRVDDLLRYDLTAQDVIAPWRRRTSNSREAGSRPGTASWS